MRKPIFKEPRGSQYRRDVVVICAAPYLGKSYFAKPTTDALASVTKFDVESKKAGLTSVNSLRDNLLTRLSQSQTYKNFILLGLWDWDLAMASFFTKVEGQWLPSREDPKFKLVQAVPVLYLPWDLNSYSNDPMVQSRWHMSASQIKARVSTVAKAALNLNDYCAVCFLDKGQHIADTFDRGELDLYDNTGARYIVNLANRNGMGDKPIGY